MLLLFLTVMIGILPQVQGEIYSVNAEFQVSPQVTNQQIGHIRFYNDYHKDGWDKFYFYGNPKATPQQQHQAAGFLEGYATYAQIYAAFKNFVKMDFGNQPHAPTKVQQFLQDQLQYMMYNVQIRAKTDPFWEYVGYYLAQVKFMHAGYEARIKKQGKPELSLDYFQVYYLSSVGDLEDLLQFPAEDADLRKNCNAYVRLDGSKLYTTQATHNRYPFLLRTFKYYSFPRENVANKWSILSSRPGDLISKDDFFLLGSGLRVLQTSLENLVPENLKEISYSTVPSWIRTLVANHLSKNADEWIKHFSTARSGTHNNQWIVIDPTKIAQKKSLAVYFEQAFSLSRTIDMSGNLTDRGYVAGYNSPLTQQIYDKLGYRSSPSAHPPYDEDIRAIVYKKYHPKMTDIEQMKYWLIMNEEEKVNTGLAPRYDQLQKPRAFGLTDCKIASQDTIKQNYLWAISGPSTSDGRFPPFDWQKWTDPSTPHEGMNDIYNFPWVKIYIDIEKEGPQVQSTKK